MVKFMYNGIKVSGELFKAHYSYSKLIGDDEKSISIYARDYARFPQEVRDMFTVQNDTDIMTDYFETDRIRVYKTHPQFKAVAAAIVKAQTKSAKKYGGEVPQELIALAA